MKVVPIGANAWRAFPHLVVQAIDRHMQWRIDLSGLEGKAGLLDRTGNVTPAGRREILKNLLGAERPLKTASCVVWAPEACTFIMPDGSTLDGKDPPIGDPVEPADYESVNGRIISVQHVPLPKDADWRFLCIRRLTPDRVEISSGEHITLGYFDELPTDGPGSELRCHLDEKGRLVPPATFRGVKTCGVANGYELLGPIQPNGYASKVVEPWPTDIIAACKEIAGCDLDAKLLQKIWKLVVSPQPSTTYTASSGGLSYDCLIAKA